MGVGIIRCRIGMPGARCKQTTGARKHTRGVLRVGASVRMVARGASMLWVGPTCLSTLYAVRGGGLQHVDGGCKHTQV